MNSDVLNITIDQWIDLSSNDKAKQYMEYISTKHLKTVEELSSHILGMIHINNLDLRPIKLQTLNRRFYRPAATIGTTVLQLMKQLMNQDLVQCHVNEKATCMYATTNFIKIRETYLNESFLYLKDPMDKYTAIEQAKTSFWSNAQ